MLETLIQNSGNITIGGAVALGFFLAYKAGVFHALTKRLLYGLNGGKGQEERIYKLETNDRHELKELKEDFIRFKQDAYARISQLEKDVSWIKGRMNGKT